MGSIYVPWLADAARSAGLRVVEVAGWRTRGHGGLRLLEIVVGHHTGTPARAAGDYPSLNVVTNGRSDLAGPLCNLGLGRDGTVYVVAAGTAWHAGASAYAGFTDLNDESLGIEAESDGSGAWTAAQLDAYPRLVAALLRYMNRGPERYASHRTVARPPGRKPDPTGIADNWMQDRVRAIGGGQPVINPAPPAPSAPAPRPSAPPFPLARDHYFGLITGPARSHGGYYASERPWVKAIQQALIRKGYVPGVTNQNSGWADGKFERPTFDAVVRFQRAEMPGTTRYGEVWWDDWAKLLG